VPGEDDANPLLEPGRLPHNPNLNPNPGQVEVATMRFRDGLEEVGGLDRPALEAAVVAHRQQLLAGAERPPARAGGATPKPEGDAGGERAAGERGAGGRPEPRNGDAARAGKRGVRCGPRQHLGFMLGRALVRCSMPSFTAGLL